MTADHPATTAAAAMTPARPTSHRAAPSPGLVCCVGVALIEASRRNRTALSTTTTSQWGVPLGRDNRARPETRRSRHEAGDDDDDDGYFEKSFKA
jgi:hypothetical protein